MLQWAWEIGLWWDNGSELIQIAVEEGHLHVLKWLYEKEVLNKHDDDGDICFEAARCRQFEILKWAYTTGFFCCEVTLGMVASWGDLEMVLWLRTHGCDWDEFTCARCCYGGCLQTLKYLHEQGCPWDGEAVKSAVEHGHLQVLQYLHANGCPWYPDACHDAAVNGKFAMLKWLRSVESPWGRLTCATECHGIIAEWLRENGCPA